MSFGSVAAFAILPIPLSVEGVDPIEAQREIKHLSLIGAVALTVGSQVGGGIFSAPVRDFPYIDPANLGTHVRVAIMQLGYRYSTYWKRRSFSIGLAWIWPAGMDWSIFVC